MTPTGAETPAEPASAPGRWDWLPKARWFAAEFLVVVLGVLAAVGINAWWQGREDAATEAAYLRQIAQDLDATVAVMDGLDATLAPAERAGDLLFESFRKADALPADSVLVLVSAASRISDARPALGTIEALVSTGDLALIGDDSLRASIPAYLEQQRTWLDRQGVLFGRALDNLRALQPHVDVSEADAAMVAGGGSLRVPRPGMRGPDSVTASRPPFPFDAERFRRDRDAYDAVVWMAYLQMQSRGVRRRMASTARELRQRVEAAQER